MLCPTPFRSTTSFGKPATSLTTSTNPNNDFEVVSPPDDSISCLEFSPASLAQNYLIAGSWDNSVSLFRFIDINKVKLKRLLRLIYM